MSMNLTVPLLKQILARPLGLDWSIQGFGMLRLYLAPDVRLHLWHAEHRWPGVSTMHDHPWDFESEIFAGRLTNRVYRRAPAGCAPTHHAMSIRCGEGSHGLDRLPDEALELESERVYVAGDRYFQTGEQWHDSEPMSGTITVIRRRMRHGASPDHATVFWPVGTEWGNAEPRKATDEEVLAITSTALVALTLVTS
jgi:hypothetical protein